MVPGLETSFRKKNRHEVFKRELALDAQVNYDAVAMHLAGLKHISRETQ